MAQRCVAIHRILLAKKARREEVLLAKNARRGKKFKLTHYAPGLFDPFDGSLENHAPSAKVLASNRARRSML